MKVVILAGGFGTPISEKSHLKPKPMIEIGEKPILWHILKLYSYYGFNELIICCGYKQHIIKEWFADYYLHNSDITFDFTSSNRMTIHNNTAEPWKVTLIDTGLHTMTTVQPDERFGVVDIEQNNVAKRFTEKSKSDVGWINGGFMVVNPEVFDYIEGDSTIFEKEPLMAYRHDEFWQCMDTQRDKEKLEELWESGLAPWKVW